MIPLAGGEAIALTAEGASSSHPAMEPGWQVPAFLSARHGRQIPGLATEPAGGRSPETDRNAAGRRGIFAWSPDGRRLLLTLQDPTPEELEEAKDKDKDRDADKSKEEKGKRNRSPSPG